MSVKSTFGNIREIDYTVVTMFAVPEDFPRGRRARPSDRRVVAAILAGLAGTRAGYAEVLDWLDATPEAAQWAFGTRFRTPYPRVANALIGPPTNPVGINKPAPLLHASRALAFNIPVAHIVKVYPTIAKHLPSLRAHLREQEEAQVTVGLDALLGDTATSFLDRLDQYAGKQNDITPFFS